MTDRGGPKPKLCEAMQIRIGVSAGPVGATPIDDRRERHAWSSPLSTLAQFTVGIANRFIKGLWLESRSSPVTGHEEALRSVVIIW